MITAILRSDFVYFMKPEHLPGNHAFGSGKKDFMLPGIMQRKNNANDGGNLLFIPLHRFRDEHSGR